MGTCPVHHEGIPSERACDRARALCIHHDRGAGVPSPNTGLIGSGLPAGPSRLLHNTNRSVIHAGTLQKLGFCICP